MLAAGNGGLKAGPGGGGGRRQGGRHPDWPSTTDRASPPPATVDLSNVGLLLVGPAGIIALQTLGVARWHPSVLDVQNGHLRGWSGDQALRWFWENWW